MIVYYELLEGKVLDRLSFKGLKSKRGRGATHKETQC
jgi:hypothetical protein